jgi:hypothetical protein
VPCAADLRLPFGEFGRGDHGAGPPDIGERLGEGGRITDDEADTRRADDTELMIERPARIDRRGDGTDSRRDRR